MVSVTTLVICAVVVYIVYWMYTVRAQRVPNVPYLKTWKVWIGDFIEIQRNYTRWYDWLYELQTGIFRGKSFCLSGPMFPPVIQMAPTEAMTRHILKDRFENYPISESRIEHLQEVFGHGIFASNGAQWRSHRKAAANIFTLRLLRDDMTPVFVESGVHMITRLSAAAAAAAAAAGGSDSGGGTAIDLQDLFFRHTLDAFCMIAFGQDMQAQQQAINSSTPKDGKAGGSGGGGGGAATTVEHAFGKAFDTVQALVTLRFFDLLWRVKRVLNVGTEKTIRQQTAILNRYAFQFVQSRRDAMSKGVASNKRTDLISHFMAQATKDGTELSDAQLRDIIVNFLVAGRDTTAVALTWFVYEMIQNPGVYAKVQAEVDQVMSGLEEPTFETASEMSFTEACLLESLRLHPSVPGDDRVALKDDTLPDGTQVRAGDICSFNPWAWGHSEEVWGADVLTFKPERWTGEDAKDTTSAGGGGGGGGLEDMKSPGSAGVGSEFDRATTHLKRHSQYKFPSFSGGMRLCMGRGLAILEAKLAIAQLFRSFEFALANPKQPITYNISVVLIMKGGLWVIPKRRASSTAAAAAGVKSH